MRQGSYTHVEEHLFTITKILRPSKYAVEPYFIDNNKVIVKEIEEQFNEKREFNANLIDKYDYCEYSSMADEYNNFSHRKFQKMFEFIENNDILTSLKHLPLKNYNQTFFNFTKENDKIKHFYDILTQYKDDFIKELGQEKFDLLGNYDLAQQHMDVIEPFNLVAYVYFKYNCYLFLSFLIISYLWLLLIFLSNFI